MLDALWDKPYHARINLIGVAECEDERAEYPHPTKEWRFNKLG